MRSLLLCLCICACRPSGGSTTRGQRGVASFAYRATPGCQDGCDLERNFLAADGAHQLLSVSGATFASVASSAPGVATFSLVPDGVEAVTALPGDTDLQLLDAGGGEVDRVTVHVAAVATFDFDRGWTGDGPILVAGVPITIAPITKRDAGVRILLGANAIRFTASGTLSSLGPTPPLDPAAPASILETLIVQGTAGQGALHAENGTQMLDLPFTVVALDDLTKLGAVVTGSYLGSGGGSVDSPVQWTASTAAGPVYGASCAWSVSDPSVLIDVVEPPTHLALAATGSLVFKMTKPGSFNAICTLGRLTVTVPLKRDS
jgi:hypothetical protein